MNLIDVSAAYAEAGKVNANFSEVLSAFDSLDSRVTAIENSSNSGAAIYTSVKDFGAVGDGVADDTEAIQGAIAAATATGGVVWFPRGSYLSGPLSLYSNITMDGEGRTASIIKLKSGSEATLLGRFSAASNIHIRNLGLDGNKAGNLSAGHPVEFHGVTDSSITHCAIYNSRQNGIRWDGCTGNLIAFNQVYGNTFCGIRCGETGTSVHTRIIGNYTLNNDVIGISVDSVSRFIISLNHSNNNGDNGIDLCASNQSSVTNNVCLSNTNQGIALDGWTYPGLNCDDNIVTGNVSMYNGQCGIDTANGNNRLIVTNNNLLNNGVLPFRDTGTGTKKRVNSNVGFITENSGSFQIPSGVTYVDVPHGLGINPEERNVHVTRTSIGGSSTKYWISNVGVSTFRVNVNIDPGPGGAWFNWMVVRAS